MSSTRYATPLRLRIEYSPRLRALFLLLVSLAILALFSLPLSLEVRMPAIALLALASFHTWRCRPELGGQAGELILLSSGTWQLDRGGKSTALSLDGQTTISQALLVLCFRQHEGRGRFDCVVWRHEVPPHLYRQLMVYLKLYAQEAL